MGRARDVKLTTTVTEELIMQAERGVNGYLKKKKATGEIAENYYEKALETLRHSIRLWLLDPALDRLSPNLKLGISDAIRGERWEDLVNAYMRSVEFGTSGIRSLMAFDKASIEALGGRDGLDARILKGPNTINNIVIMKTAYGVASYLRQKAREERRAPSEMKIVVGYDSRVAGRHFARAIAEVCLALGLSTYLFDEAVPYPEVTFAIPFLGADIGIFISASHNDYRYNGFKLSGPNGAQISYKERNLILKEHIEPARLEDVKPLSLDDLSGETIELLHFLGGGKKDPNVEYYGRDLTDIHTAHVDHIKSFLLRKKPDGKMMGGAELKIVYAAFNGSGRRAVPRILDELGCNQVHCISGLDALNGLFPAFRSDPGKEQQPDPGDPRAARIALKELEKDAALETYIPWSDADLLIGTDPDADRCGVVVRPPADLVAELRDYPSSRIRPNHMLIPADDMWALVLWYRLTMEKELRGELLEPERRFVALSHTTSDLIALLAKKFGLGSLKTWVGFGWLSTGVAHAWSSEPIPRVVEGLVRAEDEQCHLVFYDTTGMDSRRTVNDAALEQSNGFSVLGGPPANPLREMGVNGHVRDKDGTFAALLVTEIAAYAKERGMDLLTLLADNVYSDPELGMFVTYYEPDPFDGEYPGIKGDTKKQEILKKAEMLFEDARKGGVTLNARKATSAKKYWTGKYDKINWKGFPDEGLRFYLEPSAYNHITIRPSGTTNSLRFHVQLHAGPVSRGAVWSRWLELENEARDFVTEIRRIIGAPRDE